ncbi:MAG: hypothetical protein KDA46_01845 [Parvularculaceae bacterium]|nr:hypothetical protein [Parvularculaceae bacterium]
MSAPSKSQPGEADMAGEKFSELQAAIRDYGQAAFQNLLKCRALGDAILRGFPDFEGCPPACVVAVPPAGPFDPHKDYGDEAFSYHGRQVIILEPVRFGLCLVVSNTEDAGALWLRTVVSAEISGEAFEVFVAARPVIRVPLEYDGQLEPVFEAIHREFLETFTLEVNDFNDARFKTGIGFMPD